MVRTRRGKIRWVGWGLVTLVLALTTGCRKREADPAPAPNHSAAHHRRAPNAPPPTDPRFQCDRDDQCVATCALGAVTRAWWKAHGGLYRGCEDGCASKGYMARCVMRACVTFRQVDGTLRRMSECSFRPLPRPRPVPPPDAGGT